MRSLERTAHRLRQFEPLIRAISAFLRENPAQARLRNATTVAETLRRSAITVKRTATTDEESRKCNFPLDHPIYDRTFPLKLNIRNLLRPGAATVT